MRILLPLVFAVATLAFGQEQPKQLIAGDSRALLSAHQPCNHGEHGGGDEHHTMVVVKNITVVVKNITVVKNAV